MGGPRGHPCSRNLAIVRTVRLETAITGGNSPQNPASECRTRTAVGADNEQPHLLAVVSRRYGLQLLWVSTATCIAVLGVVVLAGSYRQQQQQQQSASALTTRHQTPALAYF